MCYKVRQASISTLIRCIIFWNRHRRKRKNPKQSNTIEQHDDFILAEKKPVNPNQQTGILVDINRICYYFISLEEQQYAAISEVNNSSLSPPSNTTGYEYISEGTKKQTNIKVLSTEAGN